MYGVLLPLQSSPIIAVPGLLRSVRDLHARCIHPLLTQLLELVAQLRQQAALLLARRLAASRVGGVSASFAQHHALSPALRGPDGSSWSRLPPELLPPGCLSPHHVHSLAAAATAAGLPHGVLAALGYVRLPHQVSEGNQGVGEQGRSAEQADVGWLPVMAEDDLARSLALAMEWPCRHVICTCVYCFWGGGIKGGIHVCLLKLATCVSNAPCDTTSARPRVTQ
jgi:hypothetical protein